MCTFTEPFHLAKVNEKLSIFISCPRLQLSMALSQMNTWEMLQPHRTSGTPLLKSWETCWWHCLLWTSSDTSQVWNAKTKIQRQLSLRWSAGRDVFALLECVEAFWSGWRERADECVGHLHYHRSYTIQVESKCVIHDNKLLKNTYWSQSWKSVLLVHLTGPDFCTPETGRPHCFSPPVFPLCCLDAGVPVYLYEFVYRADIHKQTRPSFVRADHADDVGFMLGGCFWNGPLKIIGRVPIICSSYICFLFFYFVDLNVLEMENKSINEHIRQVGFTLCSLL